MHGTVVPVCATHGDSLYLCRQGTDVGDLLAVLVEFTPASTKSKCDWWLDHIVICK